MCGQFAVLANLKAIKDYYEFLKNANFEIDKQDFYDIDDDLFSGHQDIIKPFQYAPIIVNESDRIKLFFARWGLIPFWAKDEKIAGKTINARLESLPEKPSFKYAFQKRRCLIPFTGFYESAPDKSKHFFKNENNTLKSFAGLYEFWGKENLLTYTIITCPANEEVSKVHHRMPLILDKENSVRWLKYTDII